MKDELYQEKNLAKVEHLQSVLKTVSNKSGLSNFWVLDTVSALKDPNAVPGNATERVDAVHHALAADGVHLTAAGYSHLHKAILGAVDGIRNRNRGTGAQRKETGYYWRGFLSPVGSMERRADIGSAGSAQGGRPRTWRDKRRAHPYSRK